MASGTSRLETERNLTNEAVLVNSGKIEKFKTVNVAANTESNTDINVISGTGGVVEVSPEAAYLNDTATNSTTTKIDGKFKVNNINVTAITTENEKRKIDATSASAVGYSGATLKHKDTTTTAVNIADKSEIETPNDLIFNVKNNITGASDLIGVGAGALRGNAADSSDIGSYTATLNLGNNTSYKTNKDFTAQSADELDVRSTNLLKAYDFASATVANSTNNFEFKNSVTGGKTTINAENIYLKAGESGKLNLSAIADHKGAAGTVKTNEDNTINRADTVTVGDSSTLKAKTVNLTTKTGENLDLNLQSDVFNYSFIPFENAPNMSLAFNQNNAINVGSGAKFTADEEMVLDGSGTLTNFTKSVRYFSTYDGGGQKSTGTTDGVEKISAMTTNNVVTVNGTLEAGTRNKIGIEITGNKYKVTDGADRFDGEVTFKNTTTKNPYYARYQEVTSAMNDYQSDSEQYKALDEERSSLISQMNSEGFLKNGNPVESLKENDVAVLPNMRVSGADIKLYGDKMTGKGSITAHRGSNINVVRKSGGAVEVADDKSVTFGNLGGIVSFNDALAKSDGSLKVTSELNDVIPVINIENRSTRSTVNSPDIKIGGLIDNPGGNVKITTNNGSINSHGTINAQSVTMSAPHGSFTMINEQALVNLSDPITYFTLGDKDISNYIQKRVALEAAMGNTNLTFNNSEAFGNWLYDTLTKYGQTSTLNKYGNANSKTDWVNSYIQRVNDQMEGGKIVAGGDIFISAKDINVNGLIQSGFTNYTGDVDTGKVNSLKSSTTLSDDDVLGNSDYLVTKNYNKANENDINAINGVVKNNNGYYDKQIELYYNPTTGNILANDIYSDGGSVTLKGNIVSTGGGKIVVSNGAADVTVNNESNKTLKLGTIESKESKGLVTIIDKKQNNKETTFSANGTYTPLKNLNYKWTGGGSYTWNTDHTLTLGMAEILKATGGALGDIFTGNWNNLTDNFINTFRSKSTGYTSNSSYSTYSTGDALKKNGIYIAKGDETPYLSINSQKRNVTTSQTSKNTSGFYEPVCDAFPVIPKNFGAKVTWSERQTGNVTSTYSMKADNPIDIKFVKGSGQVNLNSRGGISDTTVNSKSLNLGNKDVVSGNIDIKFNPVGTGQLVLSSRGDSVVNVGGATFVSISKTGNDNVTINATGDLNIRDYDNKHESLTLNSTKGRVDFRMDSGGGGVSKGLNVSAAEYVYIDYAPNTDLAIGTIESKNNEVSIRTKGNLVSAVTEKQNKATKTQIENWKATGILNTWSQTELASALDGFRLKCREGVTGVTGVTKKKSPKKLLESVVGVLVVLGLLVLFNKKREIVCKNRINGVLTPFRR